MVASVTDVVYLQDILGNTRVASNEWAVSLGDGVQRVKERDNVTSEHLFLELEIVKSP